MKGIWQKDTEAMVKGLFTRKIWDNFLGSKISKEK
jgi:hypothetical protein